MSRPLNVVGSPVIYKNKFLLIKRINPPYKGLWCMVGGKVEVGEDIKAAIVREVKEETGISAKFVAIRGVVYEALHTEKGIDDHFVIWACETRASSGRAKESGEGEVKWFTRAELKKHEKEIIPSDFAMISTFFLGKKQSITLHKSTMVLKNGSYEIEYFGVQ